MLATVRRKQPSAPRLSAEAALTHRFLRRLKTSLVKSDSFRDYRLSPAEIAQRLPAISYSMIRRVALKQGFRLNSQSPSKKIAAKAEAILSPLREKLMRTGEWNSFTFRPSEFVIDKEHVSREALTAAAKRLGFRVPSRKDANYKPPTRKPQLSSASAKLIEFLKTLKRILQREGTFESYKLSPTEIARSQTYVTRMTVRKYASILGFAILSHNDSEFREQKKRQLKAFYAIPENRERLESAKRAFQRSAAGQAMLSKLSKERWKNPEYRKNMSLSTATRMKAYYAKPENRARLSAILRIIAMDPLHSRRRNLLALAYWSLGESRRKHSLRMQALFNDPDWRHRTLQAMSTGRKKAKAVCGQKKRFPVIFDGTSRRDIIRDPKALTPQEIIQRKETPTQAYSTGIYSALEILRKRDPLAYCALLTRSKDLLVLDPSLITTAEIKSLAKKVDQINLLLARGKKLLRELLDSGRSS